jgi:AcrR family transcriptional regulator
MAAAAGVSKPVIHGEFGGKSGIAEAIALALAEQIEDRALAQVAEQGPPTLELAARSVLDSLITTVTDEPAVYAYLVRSLRADDRGLLDNALVTTLNEHTQVVVRTLSPDLDPDVLTVVTHGTFGLVFAAIESWQTTRKPERVVLLDALTAIVVQAFGAVREIVSPMP